MGFEDVGIRLIAEGEAKYTASLKNAQKSTDAMGKTSSTASKDVSKLSDSFEKMTGFSLKSAISLAGVGAALQAGFQYAQKAIKDASDLNETMSKSSVVFGDSADMVEAFGTSAATALGMSKNQAVAAAATFGNLFVSMGMSKPAAADMSTSLVRLAADLGSFNNMASSDVLEKLRAGLTGETEPLKSLGVNISAAAVQAQAMKMGLIGLNGELSASAKAQATYALILQQTVTAQGDFERTADGAANQTKILEAKMANLSASIGSELLPAFVKLLQAMNAVATSFGQAFEIANGYTNVLVQHEKEVRKTAASYREYAIEMIRSKNATRDANFTIEEATRIYESYIKAGLDLKDSEYALGKAEYDKSKAIEVAKKMTEGYNAVQANQTLLTEAAAESASHAGDAYSAMAAAYAASQVKLANTKALEAAKAKVDLLNASFSELTKQVIYNTASEGLNSEQKLRLAQSMGLINDKTYAALTAVQMLNQQFKDGQITAEYYYKAMKDLGASIDDLHDKDVTVTVNTKYNGQPVTIGGGKGKGGGVTEYAGGGMFNIPQGYGYEGYPLGPGKSASGGETVIVVPKGKSIFDVVRGASMGNSVSAGPTSYSYNTSNNYNLNLSTSQSPAVVQNSFAMMRLLAG